MQISFYVLGDRFITQAAAYNDSLNSETKSTAPVVNAEAVLNFVCKLTQTVLKKSEYSLVIVDDKISRLERLDTQLWDFEPTSFIPHNLLTEQSIQVDRLSAPVTLTPSLPIGFDGVVLNLAAAALPLKDNNALPERVLEIITPDEDSKQQGRNKYRAYRDLGFELKYYPIN